MIPDKDDRNEITQLHAIPVNQRDASGSGPSLWKNKPTKIPTPQHSRPPRPLSLMSPYSSTRMGNAHLQNNTGSMRGGGRAINHKAGNRTAGAIMTSNSHSNSPPSKRRKTTNTANSGLGVIYVAGRGNPAMKAATQSKPSEKVIDLDADENEDLGEVINVATSDDMNIIDEPVSVSSLAKRAKQQHAYSDTIDVDATHTPSHVVASGSRSVRDGPATLTLEKQLQGRGGEDSDDPIQMSRTSSPSSPKLQSVQRGRVRETVEQFENMNVAGSSLAFGAGTRGGKGKQREIVEAGNPDPGPRIDFIRLGEKTSLKNRMKSKNSSQGRPEPRDAFATKSGFLKPTSLVENGRNKALKPGTSLPISEWFMGLERLSSEGKQYMRWEDGRLFFVKGLRQPFYLMVEREIENVECLDPVQLQELPTTDAVIRFKTLAPKPSDVKGRQVSTATFKMGDQYKGRIVVKLDRKHEGWSDNTYTTFIRWIKKPLQDVNILRHTGIKVIWDEAGRMSDMDGVSRRRKQKQDHQQLPSAHATSIEAPRSLKRPASNSPDDSTPPPPGNLGRDILQHRDTSSSSSRPASRAKMTTGPSVAVRRSLRNGCPQTERPPSVDPDEVILCYPQGVPGAVNITNGDCNRLMPGEFLNDTLIEFGLKLWLKKLERSDPELAKQIHVFSSFFYKKLNKKNPEEGYESVRKWTAKIDIFSKKYIIIPINENLHWYLAIIYHPEHVLLPPPPPPPSPSTRGRRNISDATKPTPKLPSKPPSTASKPPSTFPKPPLTIAKPSSNPPSVANKPSPTASRPPSDYTTREPSLVLGYPTNRSDDEVEQILTVDKVLESITCSVTVDSEDSATATSTPSAMEQDVTKQGADEVIDTPSSPLTDMEVDHLPQTAFHRAVSKTVSEYEEEASGARKENNVADVEMGEISPAMTSRDVHELFDDDIDVEHASDSKAVKPQDFYGSLSKKAQGKQKATSKTVETISIPVVEDDDDGDEDDTMQSSSSTLKTYIFTMDSLGSRHPQAIKQLSRYLKKEAEDKKKITEASDPIGKQAFVPVQPNYCDCGLYLLHFAQTFMTNPDKYCHMINSRQKTTSMSVRQKDWDDEKTQDMRERLRQEIIELSIGWKNDRASKEQEKRKDGTDVMEVVESSDDEVDIVETRSAVAPTKGGKGKGAPQQRKAARPRG